MFPEPAAFRPHLVLDMRYHSGQLCGTWMPESDNMTYIRLNYDPIGKETLLRGGQKPMGWGGD